MAKISITNLQSLGAELFSDTESFMTALADNDLGNINGGLCACDPIFRDKETNPVGVRTIVCPPIPEPKR
jgi:hypothetical protein